MRRNGRRCCTFRRRKKSCCNILTDYRGRSFDIANLSENQRLFNWKHPKHLICCKKGQFDTKYVGHRQLVMTCECCSFWLPHLRLTKRRGEPPSPHAFCVGTLGMRIARVLCSQDWAFVLEGFFFKAEGQQLSRPDAPRARKHTGHCGLNLSSKFTLVCKMYVASKRLHELKSYMSSGLLRSAACEWSWRRNELGSAK